MLNIILTYRDMLCVNINVDKRCVNHSLISVRVDVDCMKIIYSSYFTGESGEGSYTWKHKLAPLLCQSHGHTRIPTIAEDKATRRDRVCLSWCNTHTF